MFCTEQDCRYVFFFYLGCDSWPDTMNDSAFIHVNISLRWTWNNPNLLLKYWFCSSCPLPTNIREHRSYSEAISDIFPHVYTHATMTDRCFKCILNHTIWVIEWRLDSCWYVLVKYHCVFHSHTHSEAKQTDVNMQRNVKTTPICGITDKVL